MMTSRLLVGLCFVCLLLLPCQSSPRPQEKRPGKDAPNLIEGDWTKVVIDRGTGEIWCRLPELGPSRVFGAVNRSTRWRITKESIEEGWEGPAADSIGVRFPQRRYAYKLNPGNQANAIDFSLVEKNLNIADKSQRGKLSAWEKETQRGIYYVNGDYLMICVGSNSRPKTFTSNNRDNPMSVEILRRGRSYGRKDKVIIGPKADDSGDPARKEK